MASEPSKPVSGVVARPTVAVIPAAGFGSRLRPLTNRIPKELLPVGGKLALEHILYELAAAGFRRAIVVVSPLKEARIRETLSDEYDGIEIEYAIQPEMRGLGDAILYTEDALAGETSFLVALGDAVFEEPTPGGLTSRLVAACAENAANLGLIVQRVPRARISKYGVVAPAVTGAPGDSPFVIQDIVEKPAPEDAPSEFAAAARYLVPTEIFATLRETQPGVGGEIQLTDALRTHLRSGETGVAVPLLPGEFRHDIGALDSYYRAFAAFALLDPANGASLREYLSEKLKSNTNEEDSRT